MVDRDNENPTEAERIAHDPSRVMTDWMRRYLEFNDHVSDELDEINPTAKRILMDAGRNYYEANPGHNMLNTLVNVNTNRFFLDRARHNLPTTAEIQSDIRAEANKSVVVEFDMLMTDMLRVAVQDHVDPDDTEAAYDFLRKNPKLASDLAYSSLQETLEQIGEDQQITPEIEESLLRGMAATFLSGHQPTYNRIHSLVSSKLGTILANDRNMLLLANALTGDPDRLPDLIAAEPEAMEATINKYRLADLLDSLRQATDPKASDRDTVRATRQSLLAYAQNVAFNPAVSIPLRTAVSFARKTFREGRKMVPEALSEAIELDWEPFPEEELDNYARDIVQTKNETEGRERKPATVDLARLEILKQVREWWGEERSEYRRGVRKTRKRKVETEEGEEYFDEYIILVLKHLDDDGNVIREDVVADSPIAGRNALYVQRQDVNGWEWDELLRYKKDDVKAMGARDIRHVAPAGKDMVEDVTNKVKLLLRCPEEEFLEARFNRTAEGMPRLRIPKRVLDIVLDKSQSTQTDHPDRPRDVDGDL